MATTYSCVATPDAGYVVRNETTGADVVTHLDHETARFIAWALAYRDVLWCETAEPGCPHMWERLHAGVMVCPTCGGFLQKVDLSERREGE